ncbi:MAG: hypothetical protein WC539_07750 [Nitrospirota bacterium]
MKRSFITIVLTIMLGVFSLTGCAEKGPIVLDITYQPAIKKSESTKKTIVNVGRFIDARTKRGSTLGERVVPDGMKNDFIAKGTVSDVVTDAMKECLRTRGFIVQDSSWDGTEKNIPQEKASLVLSGEVKELWIASVARTFNTNMKVVVNLKILAADPREKKIIRTLDVQSALEQDIFYSREKLQQALSEALSSALDRIFADEALKKKLH